VICLGFACDYCDNATCTIIETFDYPGQFLIDDLPSGWSVVWIGVSGKYKVRCPDCRDKGVEDS